MNEKGEIQSCDPYRLIELLMHSGKAIESHLDDALAPAGLSAIKWNALRHLSEAGGQLPLGQLAEKLSCVKSNATRLIDRLAAEQLVCRVPDPQDRRSIYAELTPKGERCFAAGQEAVHQFEHQLLEAILPEERLVLEQLLLRLSDAGPFTA